MRLEFYPDSSESINEHFAMSGFLVENNVL